MREHGEPARDRVGEVVPRRLAKIFDFAKAVGEADLESLWDSNLAKAKGVKTGQANWEAKRACPGLICVEPHYELYWKYSRLVRSIYARYSDNIEPFGMDECWVSLDGCGSIAKDGLAAAEEIRRTVREETGLTVSIGVSFSKIFAKLGSDMKKPDAVTVLDEDHWKERMSCLV